MSTSAQNKIVIIMKHNVIISLYYNVYFKGFDNLMVPRPNTKIVVTYFSKLRDESEKGLSKETLRPFLLSPLEM